MSALVVVVDHNPEIYDIFAANIVVLQRDLDIFRAPLAQLGSESAEAREVRLLGEHQPPGGEWRKVGLIRPPATVKVPAGAEQTVSDDVSVLQSVRLIGSLKTDNVGQIAAYQASLGIGVTD